MFSGKRKGWNKQRKLYDRVKTMGIQVIQLLLSRVGAQSFTIKVDPSADGSRGGE